MRDILTNLITWRSQLASQFAECSDRLLTQIAHELRQALAAVEAKRTHRRTAYRDDAQSERLYQRKSS